MKHHLTRSSTRLLLLLAITALPILASCGSSNSELTPVTGKVEYKGKALTAATVRFIPMGQTTGFGGEGRTDAEGKYTITYARGGSGLPPGQYKVVVSKRLNPDGSEPPADEEPIESQARETLPAQYSSEDSTQITKTVPPDGGTIDIELK